MTPATASLAVRAERLANSIARRERELTTLRARRNEMIRELDKEGFSTKEISQIVQRSVVRVNEVLNGESYKARNRPRLTLVQ